MILDLLSFVSQAAPFHLADHWLLLGLLGLFAMTFLGAGVIPLPVTLVVMGLAPYMPVWVVIIATVGTSLGWRMVGGKLYKHVPKKSLTVAQKMTPGWLKHLTEKHPNFSIFIFNALPLPWDPVRLIMLSHDHHPKTMMVPLTLGRLLRYTAMVLVGKWLAQYRWVFIAIMVIIVFSILYKVVEYVVEKLTTGPNTHVVTSANRNAEDRENIQPE